MSQKAFSLLELILVLSIVSIIAIIAIPQFHSSKHRMQGDHVKHQLKQHLELAKSEAIARQKPITVCGSNENHKCDSNWHKGYILFEDANQNGKRDANEVLIHSEVFSNAKGRLSFNGFASDNYLQFLPDDLTGSQNGSFSYQLLGQDAWQLIISKTARIRAASY